MTAATIALAALAHDPDGHLLAPLSRVGPDLRAAFAGIALGVTEATRPDVLLAFEATLGASLRQHPTGEEIIGWARRRAVESALAFGTDYVLHADLDHMLRWLEADPVEVARTLRAEPDAGMLIVGRSERAFAGEPQRLQRTEGLVNHIYGLMAGREADLLTAIRRMDRATAADIVAHATAETIANDVEWPLLAEQMGHGVRYMAVDGLSYRTMEDYGAAADGHDADALQWIRRLEFAGEQARAMRRFLDPWRD